MQGDWHGPAGDGEADAALKDLGRGVGMVLLDVNFDLPAEALLGLEDEPSEVRFARQNNGKVHIWNTFVRWRRMFRWS